MAMHSCAKEGRSSPQNGCDDSWELEPVPDSEDAKADTYDTDSTSETE